MSDERRKTKPEFNGCVRYKKAQYCQPCVAMASNYTYTGETDRRAEFHQYADITTLTDTEWRALVEKLVGALKQAKALAIKQGDYPLGLCIDEALAEAKLRGVV